MKAAVVGGDMRAAYLAKLFRESEIETCAVGLEKADVEGILHEKKDGIAGVEWLILNWPLKTDFAEEQMEMAELLQRVGKWQKLIFVGPQNAPLLDEERFSTYDLSRDEDFLRKNAALTAEGALWTVMGSSPDALRDTRCLVIGWGRIGSELARLLIGLGAEVTVASRSAKNRSAAWACGAKAVDNAQLAEILPETDVIFSTPPSLVLDAELLGRTKKDVRIIDLSSAPYGVDLDAARKLGRNARREPGIPGRYCPRSAAKVLAESILKIMEKGGVYDG